MAQTLAVCHSGILIITVILMMHSSSQTTKVGNSTLRWGDGQRMDNPRQGAARIIEAAKFCFGESTIESTTIDQIAQQAGVSRRTIYRYFDNKTAIIQAVVEDQAAPFFAEMKLLLVEAEGVAFRDLLVQCVLFSLRRGPQMDHFQTLLGGSNALATADIYLSSGRIREHLHDLLGDYFSAAQRAGEVSQDWTLDELLGWVGRLVHSFIVNPEPPEQVEKLIRQYLLPIVK